MFVVHMYLYVYIPYVCVCVYIYIHIHTGVGFPGDADSKESACNPGNLGSSPGSGRYPGEENGNLLQYSCLYNSMDGGAWWATVHGVAYGQTQLGK